MPTVDSDSKNRDAVTKRWRKRASESVPWLKRLIFVLVAVALVTATKRSIDRWQTETTSLRTEVHSLFDAASLETDPIKRQGLTEQAERRANQIPSLANLNWFGLAIATLLYGVGLLPPGWVLFRTLGAMNVPCTLARSTAAQILGHAGKYIPGKAMVVVIRVGAILPSNHDSPVGDRLTAKTSLAKATTSVFYETLLMMGVGGMIAGVLLFNAPLPAWVRVLAIAMAIGSAIPVCPPVMRWVLRRLQKNDSVDWQAHSISWRLFVECTLASALSWLFIGGSFAILITSIPSFEAVPSEANLLPIATSAISLGMVLGFASLLPGGAGVREYVTLLVLAPVIGPVHALLAVIAARLMFILVETILAGLAWIFLRYA